MNTKEIIRAIQYVKPNAEFSFQDDDYSTIKWDVLEGDAPTWQELLNANDEIKEKEIEAKAKREALLAKLEAIGLDEDGLKALGL